MGLFGTSESDNSTHDRDDWEVDAAKYNHNDIAGQIRLEDLRDQHYGVGRDR